MPQNYLPPTYETEDRKDSSQEKYRALGARFLIDTFFEIQQTFEEYITRANDDAFDYIIVVDEEQRVHGYIEYQYEAGRRMAKRSAFPFQLPKGSDAEYIEYDLDRISRCRTITLAQYISNE